MALSDAKIRGIKATDKVQKVYDERGLLLHVSPTGAKSWRFKYRFKLKEKQLTLGMYPEVSLQAARDKREEARKQLREGIDPSEYLKITKKHDGDTFEAIAREWFAKYSPSWAPNHSKRLIGRLEKNIFPWLGDKPIKDITVSMLLEVLHIIEKRGALETAHRVLNSCSRVFRYAMTTDRAERDPTQGLKGALSPVKSKHFAAQTDPKQFAALLRMIDMYEGSLIVCCALRFAPLVFVRPGELRTAQWADINFETAEWRFTATKTDMPHIVPLAKQAISILKEIYPLTGHGRYVFPSHRSFNRPMSDNAVLVALRRLGISKEEATGHGFRASARTLLAEVLKVRPDCIEHQLAHAVRDPNGRAYNRTTFLDERKKMMQDWADYIDEIKKKKG